MASALVAPSETFYGWDLLFKTIERSIKKKADVVIALTHYVLTKDANMRCVGLGDSKTLEEDDIGTELLPDDWNVDERKYALRYSYNKELYILLGHITEGSLIMNLLNVQTKSASNICLEPTDVIKEDKGTLFQIIPTASQTIKRLKKELLVPVFSGPTSESGTQTTPPESKDPLSIGSRRPVGQFVPVGVEQRPFGFPDIGRGDLDPLGRLGSGMMFDPRSGLPYARFDPYGPPNPGHLGNPNPDHFQPPGFGGRQFF